MRINQNLIKKYSKQLAIKLERLEESISEKGLIVSDFKLDQSVTIEIPNELNCTFYNAFCLVDKDAEKVAVFTEHNGYYEFYFNSARVIENTAKEYWHETYEQ